MSSKKFTIVDLFCGAGGASHSAVRAVQDLGGEVERFIAVNHWDAAIATHQANHPFATHYCNEVAKVDPREAVPGRRVDLLLAGPSCTHHSRARGGRPMEDQMRTGPYEVLHWLAELYVSSVVIENVPEFVDWGPLTASGRPNQRLRGAMFVQFIESLKAMGYRVAWKILNSADYGDATSRRRLFILARRSGAIVWPEPTHAPRSSQPRLFGQTRPYRSALEIIDQSIKGVSIFNRSRPLEGKTVSRIMAGFWKYGLPAILGGQSDGHAVLAMNHHSRLFDASDPMPTITSTYNFGHAEYAVVQMSRDHDATPAAAPMPTLTARNNFGLAEYAVVQLNQNCDALPSTSPLPTIAAGGGHLGLAEYAVVDISNGGVRGLDDPLPTIVSGGTHLGLAQFVVGQHGGAVARPTTEPLPTIAADGAIGLAQPVVFGRPQSYEGWTIGHPYLVSYYGTGHALSVDEPLDTVTGKPRFALCVPVTSGDRRDRLYVDILYRMLQPHELAAAMSFPADYTFTSGRPVRKTRRTYAPRPEFAGITSEEAVRMIGNAWPGETGYRVSMAAIG